MPKGKFSRELAAVSRCLYQELNNATKYKNKRLNSLFSVIGRLVRMVSRGQVSLGVGGQVDQIAFGVEFNYSKKNNQLNKLFPELGELPCLWIARCGYQVLYELEIRWPRSPMAWNLVIPRKMFDLTRCSQSQVSYPASGLLEVVSRGQMSQGLSGVDRSWR